MNKRKIKESEKIVNNDEKRKSKRRRIKMIKNKI